MIQPPIQSKIDQIARILRKEIRTGQHEAGARMEAVRSLAQRFGVSSGSVVLALDKLEQENLVRKEQGKGVFIRNWREKDAINVSFLFWAEYDGLNPYKDMLMAMASPPHLRRGFRFNTRSVFGETMDIYSFKEEVAAIRESRNVDCMLLNAANIEECMLPLLSDFPFPLVFLGDFNRDVKLAQQFSQVAGDTFRLGYRTLESMTGRGFTEIILLLPDLNIHYYKQFYDGVLSAARETNIKIDFRKIPDIPKNMNGKMPMDDLRALFEGIGQDRVATTPGIVWGIYAEEPAGIIKPWMTAASPPWIIPSDTSGDVEPFYQTVFDLIEALVRKNVPAQRLKVVGLPVILDLVTKQNYMSVVEAYED